MESISFEQHLEEIIHKAQKWPCCITASEIGGGSNDTIKEIFFESAKNKLLAYGLIKNDDKHSSTFPLTEKGIFFKSFKDEHEKTELVAKKAKIDMANAERVYKTYPLTRLAAWVGAISGIIVLLFQLPELYNKILMILKAIKVGHF